MAKTATKTQLATIPDQESPTYKRQRMLEVRSLVAAAVKHGTRVDLMGFEGTDIARSQIALQDLLSKEQEKHQRARGHIMNLKEDTMLLSEVLQVSSTGMMIMMSEMAQDQEATNRMLDNAHAECNRLAVGWDQSITENYKLKTDKNGLKLALKAALNE